MHRLKLMLALLLLACCGIPLAGAAGVGTFSIEQTTANVGVNQFGIATLYMDNTWQPPADSVSLYVGYDPAILQYVSTDWKVGNTVSAIPSGSEIKFQFADWANKYPSGRVAIADVNFRAVAEGQSTIGIRIENVRSHAGTSATEFTDLTASSLSNPGVFTVGAGGGVPTATTVPVGTATAIPTVLPTLTGTGLPTMLPTLTVVPTATGGATGLPTPISTGTIPPLTIGTTGVPLPPITTLSPDGAVGGISSGSASGSEGYTGVINRTPTVTGTATVTGTVTANATVNVTPTGGQTIVDIAAANPNFSTLVGLVQDAGLVETLSGAGPYTVFAPTNAAFAALPAGTLDGLRQDREQLTSILTYHVASGRYMASDIAGMSSISTVQGQPLTVTATGGRVRVDGANVTQADIQASNGVIHVIDAVMLPPAANVTGTATTTANQTTLPPTTVTTLRTTVPVNTTATATGFDALPLVAASLAAIALIAARRR